MNDFFGKDPFGNFYLIFGATKCNFKLVEVPITYSSRQYGETQIHRFLHGWQLIKMAFYAYKKFKAI